MTQFSQQFNSRLFEHKLRRTSHITEISEDLKKESRMSILEGGMFIRFISKTGESLTQTCWALLGLKKPQFLSHWRCNYCIYDCTKNHISTWRLKIYCKSARRP